MLKLAINPQTGKPLKVLFLGAHSDDIEIGCGGTALRLIEQYPDMQATWVVFGARGKDTQKLRQVPMHFCQRSRRKEFSLKNFGTVFFRTLAGRLKIFLSS